MSPKFRGPVALCAPAALLLALAPTASAQSPLTRLQRGKIQYAGTNYDIQSSVLSANGRYAALEATATNITNPDNNGKRDVFLVNVDTGYVQLVSHTPGFIGTTQMEVHGGNGDSLHPAISADGAWVAFASDADDLLGPGVDSNGARDVFLFHRDALLQGEPLVRISAPVQGGQASGDSDYPSIIESGNVIVFESESSDLVSGPPLVSTPQVFAVGISPSWTVLRLSNTPTGTPPNGPSSRPVISDSGSFVAFQSQATDLLPLLDGNGTVMDVYVLNMSNSQLALASRDPFGATHLARPSGNPSISSLGHLVAFESTAENLAGGNETNIDWDIFVAEWDGTNSGLVQTLTRVSNGPNGAEAEGDSRNPSISKGGGSSADGRFVVFESSANNLNGANGMGLNSNLEVFGVERTTLETSLLSSSLLANVTEDCFGASIGNDLEVVSFLSADRNLALPQEVETDMDVYLLRTPSGTPEVYCRATRSVLGCLSSMTLSGTPSKTSSAAFTISVSGLRAEVLSQFIYSVTAPNNLPLNNLPNNGYYCIAGQFKRIAGPVTTGGTIGSCNGSMTLDMNPIIQDPSYPALDVGERVWLQGWARDGGGEPIYTQAASFVIED